MQFWGGVSLIAILIPRLRRISWYALWPYKFSLIYFQMPVLRFSLAIRLICDNDVVLARVLGFHQVPVP
jgi:hypothetical protein